MLWGVCLENKNKNKNKNKILQQNSFTGKENLTHVNEVFLKSEEKRLKEKTNLETKLDSFEPDSNQRPKDIGLYSTVLRSTN